MRSICRKLSRLKTVGKHFVTSKYYNSTSTISAPFIPRTFSGIQPTGTVHLGNYLGAVKAWADDLSVTTSGKNQQLFSIVNLHAITLPQDPITLRANTYSLAASLIACGLQPEKANVQEHTQLCWILTCLSTKQALSRLSQYKDKSSHLKEVPLGLFIYPVLQAADILLYKGTRVPVGEDNLQNVELSRRLARTFNNKFCAKKNPLFPEPTPILVDNVSSLNADTFGGASRIRSLRDPTKKMSKSDKDSKSCIYVNDPSEIIREKCKKAVTDCISEVTYDPVNRPGVSNLISIHACISRTTPEHICCDNSSIDTGTYKLLLAQVLTEHLAPIRERSEYLLKNKDHLESVLRLGEDAAREIAAETMDQERQKDPMVGFHKCVFSAALGARFQMQLQTYLQAASCRTLVSNTSVKETSKKVHQLKHTSNIATPSWHKFIPFEGLRSKLANKRKPAVAVLDLHGMIAADMGRGGGGFGGRKPLNIGSTRKLIEKSFEIPRLEAILLNINSPGGSPTQSELISEYIQLLASEKKVAIYSFVEDCAASGGYWLACAGERIYITENSVVGSIGVISASFGFQDAIKYLNVERRIQTAGKRKLINDPFSLQKEEDMEFTRKILDKIHTNFKNHVMKNRGERIKGQNLETLFSGEYWVGREAIELGLADDVGTTDTFIRKEFGGPEKINVLQMKSPVSKLQQLFGASETPIDWASYTDAEQMLMQMLQKAGTLNNPSLPHIKCKL